jgi:hypothetical protein
MADPQARQAAIKKASQQVRAGGVFGRASTASKVSVARNKSATARPVTKKSH